MDAALTDTEWRVRRAAAEALGKLGEAAGDQAARLGKALTDTDSDVRRAAAQALGQLPFLRRRLFQPFRIPLTADAQLDAFDPKTYFPGSQVRSAQSRKPQLLVEAIPEITGQMVVEGESGLGKTMYMRHLLFRSKRVVVYLSATKCAKGVMSAIQAKLQGPARDSTPMRCMSPSGYKRLQRPHFR